MSSILFLLTVSAWSFAAAAQDGVVNPLVQRCPGLENLTSVACVNRYAAVLPYPFSRSVGDSGSAAGWIETNVTDPSWALVRSSTFAVFDQPRGLGILGPNPTFDFLFSVPDDEIHEAPVYVPELNTIFASVPHQGVYPQYMIDLNASKPLMQNFTANPPVYAVNGGRYYQGKIYWAVEASYPFPSPNGTMIQQAPGIYMFDPFTLESTTLLNNYFGQYFNSPNDLVIDDRGDIFFTDSTYGFAINVTTNPVLPQATWRFRPATGAVSPVENSIEQPNGIGLSPDGRTMYITSTGVTVFNTPLDVIPRYTLNSTHDRAIYAFDVNYAPPGNYLTNKRPIWMAEEYDDGFHVAANGFLVCAAGFGVDVLSEHGELLLRIDTNYTVNNIQFAGPYLDELWLFGLGGISRVRWNLKGMLGGRS